MRARFSRRDFLLGAAAQAVGTGLAPALAVPIGTPSPSPLPHAAPLSGFSASLRPAPPLSLHADPIEWADCNCPVMRPDENSSLIFVSWYRPLGRAFRRTGERSLRTADVPEPVVILDDDTPERGKWLESAWRHLDGRLYGWFHVEMPVEDTAYLVSPAVEAAVSEDDGRSWRLIGTLLSAADGETDSSFQNGFVVGGYGDFCALVGSARNFVYLYATSYSTDEDQQGIVALRYPLDALDAPREQLEFWNEREGWLPADDGGLPSPLWRPERGWRYSDPDAYWGPAIHYNRELGVYVMLLNRTAGGTSNWLQDGIFLSFNSNLDDPAGWAQPQRLASGGLWYPQVVGLGTSDGDTLAGRRSRFFMSGFSAWELQVSRSSEGDATEPVDLDREAILAMAEEYRTLPAPIARDRFFGQGRY